MIDWSTKPHIPVILRHLGAHMMIWKTFAIGLAAAAFAFASVAGTPASAEDVVARGSFEGRSDHTTLDHVSIIDTGSGYQVVLESDFYLDGAPAPTFAFGSNGFDGDTEFPVLKKNSGHQVYDLLSDIDPAAYDEFCVWCSDYSVPLGFASLN
ncbi:MAG: twin-arginine translocation pathway signal protein [Rhodospirillaceae bacterium]|nr:twin-arginine translocation pathway signal protein [Rhodospirillaceae bacterium]